MDPAETMRLLRDKLIELSDVVSIKLTPSESSLSLRETGDVVDKLLAALDYAQNYHDWLAQGGYQPGKA